jgi:hypothetical protein
LICCFILSVDMFFHFVLWYVVSFSVSWYEVSFSVCWYVVSFSVCWYFVSIFLSVNTWFQSLSVKIFLGELRMLLIWI